MRNQKEEIITLSRRPFKDKDRLIVALGKYSGKMSLLTKGAQKPGSRLAGVSEPFVYANVMIYSPKDISVVSAADIKESFSGVKSSLSSIAAAYHIARLSERVIAPGLSAELLFLNLLSCLYILESGAEPDIVKRFFEMKLCHWSGYDLNYRHCSCGANLKGAWYSKNTGCFVCERCSRGRDVTAFPMALLSYLQVLDTCAENQVRFLKFPAGAVHDLKVLFEHHIYYHLEIRADADRQLEALEEQK